jgi:long-chain acyl-CoA synthetase
VDILPVHLAGTFDALPPGASLPKKADLEVRFGRPIPVAELRERTAGLPKSDAYKAATQVIEDAVRALREDQRRERAEREGVARPAAAPAPASRAIPALPAPVATPPSPAAKPPPAGGATPAARPRGAREGHAPKPPPEPTHAGAKKRRGDDS